MSRYDQILAAIDLFRPETIIETGTWNGQNAIRMLHVARQYHAKPIYIGYDLFEDATAETDQREFNVKPHPSLEGTKAKIQGKCPFSVIELIKGNTRNTLISSAADFVFIDGGHSIETIRHDYEALKKSKVVIFDDYYTPDETGAMPDITKVGCNEVVRNLNHIVLPSKDRVEGGGFTHLVMVI